ncbi:HGxxPAAW family protein [Myceligenerans xiligouense]|nr:HGxxPAAW family protein [Myceligenerans xiligouense]
MTENQSAATEVAYLPEAAPPDNHGHTVAAWVTMTGIMVGALLSAVGVVVDGGFWMFWVGLVVCVGSLVVGGVLRGMGLGQR